ncbi:porin, partial [Bradyrhizobium sp. AS23.2]|uniref:porin n=1 Tax=Bradyrhizobium sp. AS23.2 TaxID=1680155 RepID=UPI0009680329
QNYPGNNFDGLVGGSGTVTGVNQFTYTADFGQGVTAAFSAEDVSNYYQAGNLNLSSAAASPAAAIAGLTNGAVGANGIGGTRSPNLVGMVRVDQAWGLFQASVAAHDNHVAYYGATEPTGHPDDKWGWAVQLALSIKNIPTGAGDVINISGVYTDGATRYNFQNLAGSTFIMYGSSNLAYGSLAAVTAPDTTYVTGSNQESVKTWGFRGAYTHNWDPYWNTAIYGAYAAAQFGGGTKAFLCAPGTGVFSSIAGVTSCNPDFNIGQVGLITRWTPVKNLTFSADLTWTHIDQKYAGIVTPGANFAVAKPGAPANYQLKDQDSVNLLLRAQRNW